MPKELYVRVQFMEPKTVFIVSRIGEDTSAERQAADEWRESVVIPVCNKLNLLHERADDISTPGRIDSQIAHRLIHSDLVIADLTGLNSNVMYEVGVRHGLDLPLVQMASGGTKLPFDLLGIRTLSYDPLFPLKKTEKVRELLSKMILEALDGKGSAFLPKPASIPYTGVNVEGSWQVLIPRKGDVEGHRREIILELQQEGELLRGVSIHTKRSEDIYGDPIRTYLQEGRIYNRFVQLNGKSPTPQRLLINSFLLEIVGDGRRMRGAVVAYSTVEGGIFTLPCECHQLPANNN